MRITSRCTHKVSLRLPKLNGGYHEIEQEMVTLCFDSESSGLPAYLDEVIVAKPKNQPQREALKRNGYTYDPVTKGWEWFLRNN